MRNYGIACGDDFFCRGEQRSPVDLTLLRHTGATFGRPLVFLSFLYRPSPLIICIPCT